MQKNLPAITPLTERMKSIGFILLCWSHYPMRHIGQVWLNPKTKRIHWELIRWADKGGENYLLTFGEAKSVTEAQEAMNLHMQLWVSYGRDIISDTKDDPPPKPPIGFQMPD